MTRAELQAIIDTPGFGRGRSYIEQKAQEAEALALLPTPDQIAPVMASMDSGSNWLVASFGNSSEDGNDWHVVTDSVRASQLADLSFPGDARLDAHIVAAILNCYRLGLLVKAPGAGEVTNA